MLKLYLILFLHSICIPFYMFHLYWLFNGNFGLQFTNYLTHKRNKKSKSKKSFKIFLFLILLGIIIIFNFSQLGLFFTINDNFINQWINRIISIIFLYRAIGSFSYFGFTKTFNKGNFALLDTWIYSPLFFVMAVCQFYLSEIS